MFHVIAGERNIYQLSGVHVEIGLRKFYFIEEVFCGITEVQQQISRRIAFGFGDLKVHYQQHRSSTSNAFFAPTQPQLIHTRERFLSHF